MTQTGIVRIRARLLFAVVLAIAVSMASCGGGSSDGESNIPPAIGARTLSIQPISQQTEVWCWAAAAEMVFRYYGLPNLSPRGYQCGIVAAFFQGVCLTDCSVCVSTIGPVSNMQVLINGYGDFSNQLNVPSRRLSSRLTFSSLTIDQLAAEINAGRPVLAGISAGGYSYPNISQHVVVIVGYEANGQDPRVIVNDPFPYELFPFQSNPYLLVGAFQLQPGRYSISYASLIGFMAWGNTIYGVQ